MTKHVLTITTAIVVVLGCGGGAATPTAQPAAADPQASHLAAATAAAEPQGWTGKVVETMDAGTYTYVKVDTGSEEIWAAAPKFDVAVGAQVTVPPGAPMKDFHSDSMNRTFPLVYFVSGILPAGQAPAPGAGTLPMGHPMVGAGAAPPPTVDLKGIAKADGGATVAEVHSTKAALAGKQVAVRGKVVKVNQQIMGKNWLHIQDGSGDAAASTNDLTVTSDGLAAVGDTVVVQGTVTVDKDFGAGYRYAVILEDAKVTVE